MIYESILKKYKTKEKQLALLIDPDKFPDNQFKQLEKILTSITPDVLLVGGSLVSNHTDEFVLNLKKSIDLPITLYPGSSTQFTPSADAILFLSLISGRNPEFLISHHVSVAPLIKKAGLESIPTGYMLVDGGCQTSVQYISQTQPIPSHKDDIAIATALAGQYLGLKMIYMDAGSGAKNPVPASMIQGVKAQLDIPLLIGGGLNTTEKIETACAAGADMVVVGNALEKDLSLLTEFYQMVKSC